MSTATAVAPKNQSNGKNEVTRLQDNPRQRYFKDLINGPGMQKALMDALPKHIKIEKFTRVVLGSMQQTPKLADCNPESVLVSLLRAAAMGLEPDGGPLGQGYLVPFWSGKNSRLECQFIPGYRGLIKMARNSGDVADVWAEVVYERDTFDYELGLDQTLKHKRNDEVDDPGELRYAYAVARFRDGEKKFVVMNRREVLAIRAQTSSKNKKGEVVGPWCDHEPEMWKKTAARRLCKMLPLSVEDQRLVAGDDDNTPMTLPATVGFPTTAPAPQITVDGEGAEPPPSYPEIDPNDHDAVEAESKRLDVEITELIESNHLDKPAVAKIIKELFEGEVRDIAEMKLDQLRQFHSYLKSL